MIRTTARSATLLAAIALALAGCTGGDDPTPTSQPASSSSSGGGGSTYPTDGTTAGAPTENGKCTADDSDQSMPSEAPAADAWPLVKGVGTPVSDTYGPVNRDGAVWTCFAHSPKGALFASVYLMNGIPSAAVRAEYITDDPEVESGDGEDESGTVLRGYRMTSYDETTASVELVYETSLDGQSSLGVLPVTVYWKEGRWTSTNEVFASMQPRPITGLTGYTQWSISQ